MQPVVQQPKLWRLFLLVSKLSSAVFNIWIVTHINPYFILLILMMAQITSKLHGLGTKLKTTQTIIIQNAIKMRIRLESSTKDGPFQALCIPFLILVSDGNYRSNQLQPLTPLMEKLYACKRMSIKLKLNGYTWKPQHSTLVHQQYTRKTTKVVFLLLKLKELLLELNTLAFLSVFYKKKLTIVSLLQI